MSILTLMNFLVGPLGKSFKIIKEQGKLFVEEDFTELNESQYSLYREKIGESDQKIYCIGYDEESKEFEVVNEDEKENLIYNCIAKIKELESTESCKAVVFSDSNYFLSKCHDMNIFVLEGNVGHVTYNQNAEIILKMFTDLNMIARAKKVFSLG